MKMKKEYIFLLAVIVALSAYVIFRDTDRTHYELPTLPTMDEAQISKIEISKGGTTIVLDKEGSEWLLRPEGYPANEERVEDMLESMETLTVTALVSESESYGRYDLDEEDKITVKAWAGDVLKRDFAVGKAASSFQHTFVKLSGNDRVYHGRGNLRNQFDQTVEGLRDKTVLSFDRNDIQEIHITKGKESLALKLADIPVEVKVGEGGEPEASPRAEKPRTGWQTPDGKEGDKAKIERLLMTLSDLHCERYIDDRKKEDYKDPICTLLLKGTQEYTLSIFEKGDKNDENYPATSSENDYPFMLPKWQAENLMKKPGEMLKKPDKS
jgi:hypothetical protein